MGLFYGDEKRSGHWLRVVPLTPKNSPRKRVFPEGVLPRLRSIQGPFSLEGPSIREFHNPDSSK